MNSYRLAERISARENSNLYLASQYLEDHSRYFMMISIYAILRLSDDVVDEKQDYTGNITLKNETTILAHLNRYQVQYLQASTQQANYLGLGPALGHTCTLMPPLSVAWNDFFSAMKQDLTRDIFTTYDDFLTYAKGATGAPTSLMLQVYLSHHNFLNNQYVIDQQQCLRVGRMLGEWAYIVHFLRDFYKDLVHPHTIPLACLEDLHACDLSLEDLKHIKTGHKRHEYRHYARMMLDRAQVVYHATQPELFNLLKPASQNQRFVVQLIIKIYAHLADKLYDAPDAVFDEEACHLSATEYQSIIRTLARELSLSHLPEPIPFEHRH